MILLTVASLAMNTALLHFLVQDRRALRRRLGSWAKPLTTDPASAFAHVIFLIAGPAVILCRTASDPDRLTATPVGLGAELQRPVPHPARRAEIDVEPAALIGGGVEPKLVGALYGSGHAYSIAYPHSRDRQRVIGATARRAATLRVRRLRRANGCGSASSVTPPMGQHRALNAQGDLLGEIRFHELRRHAHCAL